MDLAARVARAWLKGAGDLLQFPSRKKPEKRLPKVPTVRIAGRTYRLSNIPGHMFLFGEGGDEPPPREDGGARVIKSPPRFNYLWVVEKTSREVTMWVFSEGNEKLRNYLRSFPPSFLQKLEDMGALNEVSASEQASIERAMSRKAQTMLRRSQEAYLADNPVYAQALGLARDMYRRSVVPEFKRRWQEYQQGVIPVGFKDMGSFPIDRQVASHLLGEAQRRLFTEPAIEAFLTSKKFPVDTLGSQDLYFIMHEVMDEEARKHLPSIR